MSGPKEPEPTFIAEEIRKPLGRKEVAKGFAWITSMNVAAKFFFAVFQLFFYRLLGPGQMGVPAVLIPIYMICESLRDAGLALTYVADHKGGGEREGQYASLAMINAVFFAAIIFLVRGFLVTLFRAYELDWGLQMVALAILLTGFSTIPANKLQKNARFRDASLVDVGSTVLSLSGAIVLVSMGWGYKALVWQFVLKSVFFTLGCWLIEPVRFTWIRRDVVSAVWKHASHNLLNNISFTFYTVADNLLVTRLFGLIAVGNYNAAYTFGMKPVDFFSSPLAKTLLIAYTRKSHDLEALTTAFVRTIALSLLAMAPLYALIGAFAKTITVLLLSSKFHAAGPILAVLVPYCAFRSVGLLCGNVLVAMNRPVLNVYGWICAYVVVIGTLLLNRDHLSLNLVVEALTVGAMTVYTVTGIAAFSVLRPKGENALKLWRSLGLASASVMLACGATWLPFSDKVNLAIGSGTVGLLLAVGMGVIYAKSPGACFSKSGLKAVLQAV